MNVVGEVDVISSVSLSDEISQAASTADQEVILNLEGVRFIDSSGLRVIVTAEAELSEAGLTLSIGGLSAAAQRVLELTGLINQLQRRT